MATIKSYTDIEQSKKLAEILPLESADTIWDLTNPDLPTIRAIPYEDSDYNNKYLNIIPAWSLTALLNVMPQINDWITPYGHKNDKLFQFEPKICKIWGHNIIPSYKVTYDNELSTDIYNNPVDACVVIIEKLHELKML